MAGNDRSLHAGSGGYPGTQRVRPAHGGPRTRAPMLLPTLFDRLRDESPSRAAEDPREYAVTAARLRAIVQRDLINLLNSTNAEDLIDRGRYPEAAASTVNFGVPALAGNYLVNRRWEEVERILRRAINDFEPRLVPNSLQVRPLAQEGALDSYNVLVFEIRALIHFQPYPLELTVQSAVDLETNRIRLEHASDGREPAVA